MLVPILIPGVKHTYETEILCVDPLGRGGNVLIFLQGGPHYAATTSSSSTGGGEGEGKEDEASASATPLISAVPIASANVIMPAAEMFDAAD
jgi:hypothetical protein